MLAAREEQGSAWKRLTRRKDDALEQTVVAFKACDAGFSDFYVAASQVAAPLRRDRARAVGTQDDVSAPLGEPEREPRGGITLAVRGDRLVAPFPAVAIG